MHDVTSPVPAGSARDSERTYLADLASTPRFDAARETELAETVRRHRRAYWTVLLHDDHLEAALEVLVSRAKDEEVIASAVQLMDRRADRERKAELERLLDRVGDEHAASDAIVKLAAIRDAQWHRDAVRSRGAFLGARNRFVAANLRLVVLFAKRYGHSLMPLGDRIQEGNLGLLKAVDRFDPERGVRFSTYAAWWIRHAIVRALANGAGAVRIPTQIHQLVAKAERTRRQLFVELGRDPELREIAAAVDCDPDRLAMALRAKAGRDVSLDAVEESGSGLGPTEGLCDAAALAELEGAVEGRDRERAIAALAKLSPRERDIVHERFALPGATTQTFEEIGQRHGISRERARQVQRIALERLRRTLEPRPTLRPYGA